MSNTSKPKGRSPARHLDVLVVQSNPADTALTVEAFKVAGLTTGLHCVDDGADALAYVRQEGKYAKAPIPNVIFLDLSHPRISAR